MSEKIPLRGMKVTIGMPCGANIPWQTTMSLAGAIRVATKVGVDLQMACIAMNSDVCDARSAVLTLFMESDSEYLFWIDSDMEFSALDFIQMLGWAKKYDVVSAAYPLKNEERRVVLNGVEGDNVEVNRDGLVKVESLGLGFTIVSRAALEKLVATKRKTFRPTVGREILHAFSQSEDGGEDITFFRELRGLGYTIWLDPTIQLGHVGPFVFKRDVLKALGIEKYYTTTSKE